MAETGAPFDAGNMTPAEHLEAVLNRMGWNTGDWEMCVHATDGRVRVVTAEETLMHIRPKPLGRRALDVREPAA